MKHEELRYQVSEYLPFIIKTVSEATGRYVEVENSIELSIALEKFVSLQDTYDEKKSKFMTYAYTVMKNAIIDYQRKENRMKTVAIDNILEQPTNDSDISIKVEMNLYENCLKSYKIDFETLVNEAPKHKETRIKLIRLGRDLSSDQDVITHLMEKKRLPLKDISNRYDVTLKVIKSHKCFVIAVILAYKEDVGSVLDWIEGI